jgi:hypothetical protein
MNFLFLCFKFRFLNKSNNEKNIKLIEVTFVSVILCTVKGFFYAQRSKYKTDF